MSLKTIIAGLRESETPHAAPAAEPASDIAADPAASGEAQQPSPAAADKKEPVIAKPAAAPEASSSVPADPGTVAEQCGKADVAYLAKPLIDAKAPLDAVEAAIAEAKTIHGYCAMARAYVPTIGGSLAQRFVLNGSTPAEVGEKLLDMMVDHQSAEISNKQQPGGAASGGGSARGEDISAPAIYDARKKNRADRALH